MSARIQYDTSLTAASANNVCLSQTPAGAGNLVLNGALVSGGVATMDATGAARQLLLTTNADETAKTFTIFGTLTPNGAIVSEAVVGVSSSTVASVNMFLTVTKITVSAATAAAITFGTNGVGASVPRGNDRQTAPFTMSVATILKSGSVNWTIEHTYNDVFDPTVIPVWFDHSVIAAQAANKDGVYSQPVAATRTKINSGTGVVTTIMLQASRVGV